MQSIMKMASMNYSQASRAALVNYYQLKQWQREQQYKRRADEYRRRQSASVIGSFGANLVFEVSDRRILTPENWKRNQSSRWAEHNILNASPRSEYQGPERMETTMTVLLSAEHGVKPKKMLETIEEMVRKGDVEYLVLGGKIFGWNAHRFLLESSSASFNRVYNRGELVSCSVDLTFREYW